MAKAFSMHMLALKPGVKGEDLEKFAKEKVYPNFEAPPGYKGYLLKGEKGADCATMDWTDLR